MTDGVPELSVVIPMYDCAELITAQLEGLRRSLASGPRAEILVVDNRSTDGSAEVASRWSRSTGVQLRIIEAYDRPGEPYARNVGWRHARSEAVAFCDADDVVGTFWAPSMAQALRSHDYVTGPVDTLALNAHDIADIRGRSLFDSIATVYDLVPYAHGCNMAFSRSLLERLGGFDETFLVGCDIEIAVRAWRTGVELVWDPGALVHYRLRSSPAETYRQARSYGRVRHRIAALVPEAGFDRTDPSVRLRRVAWLARHLPDVRERAGRAKWAWVAGQTVGEVEGFVRPGRA